MATVRFIWPIRASLLAAVLTEVLHGLSLHGLLGERVLDREPLHCHSWTYDPIFPRSGEYK